MKNARIFAGIVIITLAYVLFLNPYSISVGGMTGLAVALNRSFHIPYTPMLIVFNIALFIAGIKVKGWAYTVRSFLAMLFVGILLDLPYPSYTPAFSKSTCIVVGSACSGIGYGLVISTDTSTGGSDQLALIILFSVIAVLLCNGAIDLTDMLFNRKAAPDWLNKSMNWYKRMSPQLRYAMGILIVCEITIVMLLRETLIV